MTSDSFLSTVRRRLQWRHRWTVGLVAIATASVALTYLTAANYTLVDLRLIGWSGTIRLSWVLIGAVVFGFVLGLIIPRCLRLSTAAKR